MEIINLFIISYFVVIYFRNIILYYKYSDNIVSVEDKMRILYDRLLIDINITKDSKNTVLFLLFLYNSLYFLCIMGCLLLAYSLIPYALWKHILLIVIYVCYIVYWYLLNKNYIKLVNTICEANGPIINFQLCLDNKQISYLNKLEYILRILPFVIYLNAALVIFS